MGAEPNKPRLDPAELEDLAEDQEDAPLLQTSEYDTLDLAKSFAAPAAEQPPVPVSVQRDCNIVGPSDSKYKGYRTSLCDCCAEPGGARLCKHAPDIATTALRRLEL